MKFLINYQGNFMKISLAFIACYLVYFSRKCKIKRIQRSVHGLKPRLEFSGGRPCRWWHPCMQPRDWMYKLYNLLANATTNRPLVLYKISSGIVREVKLSFAFVWVFIYSVGVTSAAAAIPLLGLNWFILWQLLPLTAASNI